MQKTKQKRKFKPVTLWQAGFAKTAVHIQSKLAMDIATVGRKRFLISTVTVICLSQKKSELSSLNPNAAKGGHKPVKCRVGLEVVK